MQIYEAHNYVQSAGHNNPIKYTGQSGGNIIKNRVGLKTHLQAKKALTSSPLAGMIKKYPTLYIDFRPKS